MVGEVNDDRVAVLLAILGQCVDHLADLLIDVLLKLVVETVICAFVPVRLKPLRVLRDVTRLSCGLGAQALRRRLVVGGAEQIARHIRAGQLLGQVERARVSGKVRGDGEVTPQGDVMRVHE